MMKGKIEMKGQREQKDSWARVLGLAFFVALTFLAGSPAFAQPVPGGTLDPTTIPKYVQPLVIPPEMPKMISPSPAADYDIAVRQFKQQILPGGIWNTVNGRTDAFGNHRLELRPGSRRHPLRLYRPGAPKRRVELQLPGLYH